MTLNVLLLALNSNKVHSRNSAVMTFYATVLISRITDLARPSLSPLVCLSVPYSVLTEKKQNNAEKTRNCRGRFPEQK